MLKDSFNRNYQRWTGATGHWATVLDMDSHLITSLGVEAHCTATDM